MSFSDLQEYVRSFDRAVYRIMACGRSAPSEARLGRFEDSIGYRFPEEFRQLTLSPLGGLCFEVFEELWKRPAEAEDEHWKSLYSVRIFGLGIGAPAWLDLRDQLAELPEEETDLIPFMARGDEAERFCFDLDQRIILWSPSGEREHLDQELFPLILEEFQALEKRWERYKESRPKKKRKRKSKV